MSEETIDLKAIRERLGLTQAELAQKLGLDRSSVAHAENGRPLRKAVRVLLANLIASSEEGVKSAETSAT